MGRAEALRLKERLSEAATELWRWHNQGVTQRTWFADRWSFSVDEVANGTFEAIADDQQGLQIRHSGPDPDQLLDRCRREAAELTQRRRDASG